MCKECCGCLTELDIREIVSRELEAIAEDMVKDNTGNLQEIAMVRAFVYGLADSIRLEKRAKTVNIGEMNPTFTPVEE